VTILRETKLELSIMKLLLSILTLVSVPLLYAQQYSKVKIYSDATGLQQLAQFGVPVDHGISKQNTFFISDFSSDEIKTIAENGFQYEILIKDVKRYYSEQNTLGSNLNKNVLCSGAQEALPAVPVNFDTDASSYAGFYRYQEMLDELDAMATQYPNLISVKAPISTFLTWESRPVYHVKISDNPATDEASETKVLYTAIHHAREPMSMSQTIFYMWYLLENYATSNEIQFLVDNTEMYFVPCINPDGYIHNESNDPTGFGMHRKNKRPVGSSNPGVDLNRNYSYGWGTTGVSFDPNNDTYPGGPDDGNDYSFSEPESQAIQWLVENVNFKTAFNAHSHGNLLLFPIGTTNGEFADHHDYFTDLSGHMCSKNGYFPQKSSGLYPASGDSDDYMYKVDNGVGVKDTIFVMTPEIGSAFWPSQSEVVPTCQGMVFPNMILSHVTHLYLSVSQTDPGFITALTGDFNHSVQRLGFENGAITVSIDPLLNIQSVGAGVSYNLNLRESSSGTISYVLDPAIQFGDEIRYVLKTEYPSWTKRDTIVKTYGSMTLQFADDCSNMTNWTGPWSTTTAEFYSPATSITDSPGNYQSDANESCEFTQDIDLTNATDAMVSFYAMWEIESDYDYCQFQVSTNGGNTWIGQCGNYTVEGVNSGWGGGAQPDGEPVYEGAQLDWVLEEINLSDYLGQTIKVRFQFESDGGLEMDGFYFDDFSVSYNVSGGSGLNETNFEVNTFPNPANNEAIISTSKVIADGTIAIYDQAGKIVWEKQIKEQTNKIVVNTASLPQAVYFVHVTDNGALAKPAKLVVMH